VYFNSEDGKTLTHDEGSKTVTWKEHPGRNIMRKEQMKQKIIKILAFVAKYLVYIKS
jgi:hypothetical protein